MLGQGHRTACATESCSAGHIILIGKGRRDRTQFIRALMSCFVMSTPEDIRKRKV